jgi:hypothetical protein
MAQEVIHVSDLSGQRIDSPDEQRVDILVTDHPDLEPGKQVRLEALPDEIKDLGKYSIAAVGLLVTRPEDEVPSRHILTKANFDKLATHKPMNEVLTAAAPVKSSAGRRSHNQTTSGDPLRTFDTLESAGLPHQGKVSAAEAKLVRENLEAVNANRATQNLPPIDPANPMDAKRYGFNTLS